MLIADKSKNDQIREVDNANIKKLTPSRIEPFSQGMKYFDISLCF